MQQSEDALFKVQIGNDQHALVFRPPDRAGGIEQHFKALAADFHMRYPPWPTASMVCGYRLLLASLRNAFVPCASRIRSSAASANNSSFAVTGDARVPVPISSKTGTANGETLFQRPCARFAP